MNKKQAKQEIYDALHKVYWKINAGPTTSYWPLKEFCEMVIEELSDEEFRIREQSVFPSVKASPSLLSSKGVNFCWSCGCKADVKQHGANCWNCECCWGCGRKVHEMHDVKCAAVAKRRNLPPVHGGPLAP